MLREKVISYIRGYCEGHTTNVIADFTTAWVRRCCSGYYFSL
jgi:hypothetical protein